MQAPPPILLQKASVHLAWALPGVSLWQEEQGLFQAFLAQNCLSYPSTVSCTPALELAMSLVSMNKSSFQSSDAPITLSANVQVPYWGTDVGFGAL